MPMKPSEIDWGSESISERGHLGVERSRLSLGAPEAWRYLTALQFPGVEIWLWTGPWMHFQSWAGPGQLWHPWKQVRGAVTKQEQICKGDQLSLFSWDWGLSWECRPSVLILEQPQATWIGGSAQTSSWRTLQEATENAEMLRYLFSLWIRFLFLMLFWLKH